MRYAFFVVFSVILLYKQLYIPDRLQCKRTKSFIPSVKCQRRRFDAEFSWHNNFFTHFWKLWTKIPLFTNCSYTSTKNRMPIEQMSMTLFNAQLSTRNVNVQLIVLTTWIDFFHKWNYIWPVRRINASYNHLITCRLKFLKYTAKVTFSAISTVHIPI